MSVQTAPIKKTETPKKDESETPSSTPDVVSTPNTGLVTSSMDVRVDETDLDEVGIRNELSELTDESDTETEFVPEESDTELADDQALLLETLVMERAPDFSSPVSPEMVRAHGGAFATKMSDDTFARTVLEEAFKKSWSRAKDTLVGDPNGEKAMAALVAYRERAYAQAVELTKTEMAKRAGAGALTKATGAGSTGLTSDIDGNFKGHSTEEAVAVFNDIFSNQLGWGLEAGVVFDINVYATDFMHDVMQQEQDLRTKSEAVRSTSALGGVTTTDVVSSDLESVTADVVEQRSWALVKTRHYMTAAEWAAFRKDTETVQYEDAYDLAESRHLNYYTALISQMLTQSELQESDLDGVDDLVDEPGPGVPQASLEAVAAAMVQAKGEPDQDIAQEQLMLSASNRLYEETLSEVSTLRKQLSKKLQAHDLAEQGGNPMALQAAEKAVEGHITLLRDTLSMGSLFANEAYLTDGAVNHAVEGIQKGSPIRQTKTDGGNAIIENMGDALKEIRRHGDTLGEAGFKSAKYIYRMADAAKNAGIASPKLGKLLKFSDLVSNKIKKNKSLLGTAKHDESAKAAATLLDGVNSPESLAKLVREAGAYATKMVSVDLDEQLTLSQPIEAPGKKG